MWQDAWLRAGHPGCRTGGDFSLLLRAQTGPGIHSASYKMSTGCFPVGKDARKRYVSGQGFLFKK